ncbi:MAG: amidohydrolase family protein [Acidimicrobiaceae bacterium]|nr:amidohydrolase family protein [Acidimicrobiaceae bacterium]MYG55266.1 amidohydrolase family protein [Acidimicrobiaceae bacterium]MYJ99658.1 amidohydrolase family protein [Acidimicrobiaceae bacterium]
MTEKIWTHSADSHFLEPKGHWHDIMPRALADRMPRVERISDDEERVTVDGKSFLRPVPKILKVKGADGLNIAEINHRPPGARDINARMLDLDQEGVWAEVMFQSIGLWCALIEDPELISAAARAENEWLASEIQAVAPDRLVPAALMPLVDVDAAVAALYHAAEVGLHLVNMPTGHPKGAPDYNDAAWDPLWAAADETGLVIAFHIGTDGGDQASNFRGPGGAVLNYVHSRFGGQYAAMKLVASGAFERHQGLRVLIAEGGATWVPFIGDRMNEGFRQHSMFVRPKLARPPKDYLYEHVYASFQHDETAPAAMWAMGYRNVLFGSDYPHIEGTFGHTQETLHSLLDGLDEVARHRITRGAFEELFPHVSAPPAVVAAAS